MILEGQPLNIPDDLVIDVSDLAMGDKVTAAEIGLPDGVNLISKPDMVCVSVSTP